VAYFAALSVVLLHTFCSILFDYTDLDCVFVLSIGLTFATANSNLCSY